MKIKTCFICMMTLIASLCVLTITTPLAYAVDPVEFEGYVSSIDSLAVKQMGATPTTMVVISQDKAGVQPLVKLFFYFPYQEVPNFNSYTDVAHLQLLTSALQNPNLKVKVSGLNRNNTVSTDNPYLDDIWTVQVQRENDDLSATLKQIKQKIDYIFNLLSRYLFRVQ